MGGVVGAGNAKCGRHLIVGPLLSGSRARLTAAWRAFHVVPPSARGGAFGRSAPVYVLDRAGRPRVIFQLEQLTPEGLAHDVRAVQRESH